MNCGDRNSCHRKQDVFLTKSRPVLRRYLKRFPNRRRQHFVSAKCERPEGPSLRGAEKDQVVVRRQKKEDHPELVHLSIRRLDRQPLGEEHFRDLQRIKNELVGPEYEGVELYPAESRLADSANQYHLWVIREDGYRFPFGFEDRLIVRESGGGAVQRPFDEDDA